MNVRAESVLRLSFEQVCARRLERHALAAPVRGTPAEVVAAMAGTHAQVMSAAELAVGLRLEGATRADVREALWGDRSLVKAFGPRGTVHLLPAVDLSRWVGALSALPQERPGFTEKAALTPGQTEEVVAAAGEAVRDGDLTVEELGDRIVALTGGWAGDLVMPAFQGMWPRWRQALPLAGARGAVCFGPNRGRKVTYSDPRRRVPGFRPAGAEESLGWLVRSYLHAYGPSTPERFAHWASVPAAWARELFASLGAGLERVEVEGEAAWTTAGDTAVPADPPQGVRLLPYFDGYAYRVGNQPPALLYPGTAGQRALRGNFQLLLVEGRVAGLWHQRRSGRRIEMTVESFAVLDGTRRAELEAQVARVGEVLEGEPRLTLGPVTVGGHA
ncbi:winged helix DNA-binding domain-containing protein [Actinomadura xylanilytica]|uniref:winged helix DNA-binding domain-containing protein n=1 Tax=Actinomadura xylanilytica TaxID=887459 RepID=UPI00255AD5B7|nr:winged helix DNA-binding domain-containing protein [Actinomadura xylanilytica]MDL4776933.1 winged helix DNA-binding domain-containing protein [Actinomadura xylanilytica]